MPYLFELLLFLLPFAGYALWRRVNPSSEPSTIVLTLLALTVALGLGGAVWYGLSRSVDRDLNYVAPQWEGEGGEIEPGHAAPGAPRPAAPRHPGPRRPSEVR